jgi:predicted XRE-type DNA-binding protein
MAGLKKQLITIEINQNFSLRDWVTNKTTELITNRYKQTHIAEDMNVTNTQLSRFLNGMTVKDSFYEKWFKWYINKGS